MVSQARAAGVPEEVLQLAQEQQPLPEEQGGAAAAPRDQSSLSVADFSTRVLPVTPGSATTIDNASSGAGVVCTASQDHGADI